MRTPFACLATLLCLSACNAVPGHRDSQGQARDVNPESKDSVVAVVMPGGRAVFVVAPYKERALAKANVVAELAAKEAREERREFKPVEPHVFLFTTPAELFAAASLPDGQVPGQ